MKFIVNALNCDVSKGSFVACLLQYGRVVFVHSVCSNNQQAMRTLSALPAACMGSIGSASFQAYKMSPINILAHQL